MRNILYLFILTMLLSAYSCDDEVPPQVDGVATMELALNASFGNDALVLNEELTYTDGNPFFFTKFQFYLSDISLVSVEGEEVQLSEIELVEFVDGAATLNFNNVPTGEYTNLAIGVGVSSDLNSTKPGDYGSEHPLSSATNYWTAWGSYIFTMIEGRMDTDSNGEFETGFVYHLGSDKAADNLYNEIILDKSIMVEADGMVSLSLSVDLEKVLVRSENDFIDIANDPQVHDQLSQMQYVVDNFSTAITIE